MNGFKMLYKSLKMKLLPPFDNWILLLAPLAASALCATFAQLLMGDIAYYGLNVKFFSDMMLGLCGIAPFAVAMALVSDIRLDIGNSKLLAFSSRPFGIINFLSSKLLSSVLTLAIIILTLIAAHVFFCSVLYGKEASYPFFESAFLILAGGIAMFSISAAFSLFLNRIISMTATLIVCGVFYMFSAKLNSYVGGIFMFPDFSVFNSNPSGYMGEILCNAYVLSITGWSFIIGMTFLLGASMAYNMREDLRICNSPGFANIIFEKAFAIKALLLLLGIFLQYQIGSSLIGLRPSGKTDSPICGELWKIYSDYEYCRLCGQICENTKKFSDSDADKFAEDARNIVLINPDFEAAYMTLGMFLSDYRPQKAMDLFEIAYNCPKINEWSIFFQAAFIAQRNKSFVESEKYFRKSLDCMNEEDGKLICKRIMAARADMAMVKNVNQYISKKHAVVNCLYKEWKTTLCDNSYMPIIPMKELTREVLVAADEAETSDNQSCKIREGNYRIRNDINTYLELISSLDKSTGKQISRRNSK